MLRSSLFSGIPPCNIEVLMVNSLPESLPTNVKVSFFEHQRKEWEKVLESSKNTLAVADTADCLQHWESVNSYALAKIQEIDRTLEELKLSLSPQLSAIKQ
jgi:hypothetical protein